MTGQSIFRVSTADLIISNIPEKGHAECTRVMVRGKLLILAGWCLLRSASKRDSSIPKKKHRHVRLRIGSVV